MANTTEEQAILDIKVKYEDAIYGVIRYKEKIDALNESQKELKQQLKDGKITLNEYKVQSTAAAAVLTQYKDNVRVLNKELQNNVRYEQEQQGSLKQLRAELSNCTKAYDELSKAEREGAKGQALKKHINDITTELKGCEEATQRFYRNVGNYEGAINNAVFGNSKFGQSLQAIIDMSGQGQGLQGVLQGVTQRLTAFKSAALGMFTNPYFLAMAGVAGAGYAFKWFYDYNNGLITATRLTKEFTGYTGESLENLRNNIQATADTFGKSFQDVLASVDVLMNQYSIDGDKAMTIINNGFESGADLSGEMLQMINQYAPAFNDAGIAADELVAIIQQTRSGLFGKDGMDAIVKAGKSLRNMSSSTAAALDAIGISSDELQKKLADGSMSMMDAIQQIAAKLQELPPNAQEVGEVIDDVFGKKGTAAGQKQIQELANLEKSLDAVKESAGGYAKITEENQRLNRELNQYLSAMFDMSQKGWGTMIAQCKQLGTKVLIQVLDALMKSVNWFIELYNESMLFRASVSAIVINFKVAWEGAKLFFNLVIDGFKSVGRAAKGVLEILEGIATMNFDKAKKGFMDIVNNVGETFNEEWKDIKTAGYNIGSAYIDGIQQALDGKAKTLHLANFVDNAAGATKSQAQGSVSKSGKSGSMGGSNVPTTNKSTDADAARQKEEEKKLQEAILRIKIEYNEKTQAAKKMFIAGMYDNDKQYQQDLDDLQKQELNAMLDVYVEAGAIGEEKAREISNKLLDILVNSKKNMEQEVKNTVESINKEFEEAEKARKDANILAGGTGDDEDTAAKLQRYQDFLTQKMALYSNDAAVRKQLQQELHDNEVALQEDANKKVAEKLKSQQQAMADVIASIGDGLADFFNQEDKSMHSFLKSMLTQVLSSIEKIIEAYYAEMLARELAKKSWTGVASAAGMMALVKAAFSAAKAGVKSFAVGGLVTGRGTATSDSIPARLSNGESVMTAQTTSMFAPLLSAFNQLGGGVPIVVNNSNSQMGEDMLAAAVAKGYAMAPSPVVSVVDIDTTRNRVKTIENIGTL